MSDTATAKALEIAERHLIKLGWRFGPDDIGECAARILTQTQIHVEKYTSKKEAD